MAKLNPMKRELYKLLISLIFTCICETYYLSGLFRNSISDAFYRLILSPFESLLNFAIFIILIFLGYLVYNIVYFTVKFVLSKLNSEQNVIKWTSSIIFLCLVIYITNDQLIILKSKSYVYTDTYTTLESNDIKIDSTNFINYKWHRKAWDFSDPEYLYDELLTFRSDSTFTLSGTAVIFDRLYLFRDLLNIRHDYIVTGDWIYENKIIINQDSSHIVYTIQIRNNRLHLNSCLADAI